MKIALVGNPNSGKSSLFNQLTGLNQKIGNFAGVTVDKKTGFCQLNTQEKVEILDLPGTYSLYPKSLDEKVVLETLINPQSEDKPDLVLVIADASNLKRNLLLFTQVKDLGLPIILVLNLVEVGEAKGIHIDTDLLQSTLGVDVVALNARTGKNIAQLKQLLSQKNQAKNQPTESNPFINTYFFAPQLIKDLKDFFQIKNDYLAFQYGQQYAQLDFLSKEQKTHVHQLIEKYQFNTIASQSKETVARYEIIDDLLKDALQKNAIQFQKDTFSDKIDKILLHRVWGYLVFFGVLFLIFQSIFTFASYPMEWIDQSIGALQTWLKDSLPKSLLTDLLADGIIAGLGGILVFIPQIAILFAFISILEESGYMARVMFLMDKLMRVFGLNGRSVVPLISGVACAIPAIMATRNIDNWKERLITIFVTPLMSCSARLPVYTVLIALVVPNNSILGIFNLQGLALMSLYLLGFVMALVSAWVMQQIIHTSEKSFLIMELPGYKVPRWANIGLIVGEKVKIFVFEAGKMILAISIILWVMASYGPSGAMEKAEKDARNQISATQPKLLENKIAALKLEYSYAGQFGKFIEPAIAPLGFDWKIGIALITSFAAREVFVGTISTIYSVGNDNDDLNTVRKRLEAEINPKTGKKMFTPAVGFSLMVFYAFAMQCMSTIAVVHRETKGWKYPILQFIYLTALAYLSSFLVYQLLA